MERSHGKLLLYKLLRYLWIHILTELKWSYPVTGDKYKLKSQE